MISTWGCVSKDSRPIDQEEHGTRSRTARCGVGWIEDMVAGGRYVMLQGQWGMQISSSLSSQHSQLCHGTPTGVTTRPLNSRLPRYPQRTPGAGVSRPS
ncbi:hypothetical protein DPEC_G00272350 [Dallia pectoralis]|uniref:Uncharacterized protein n=1 Tax=Dallia pectoralis TaxID=75939 RepID=A0ACC2FQ00_DALPE|nr:hypothetical protein DPEC_G00272350 [Dallia pectoralis]